MCASRKYPYPTTEGNGNSEGGAGPEAQEIPEGKGAWMIKITFQGINFELSTNLVDHF